MRTIVELENEVIGLRNAADELAGVLQSVIDGAVHPDVAARRVMVDLAPIRAALKRYRASYPKGTKHQK